jgi:hypothetical protein
VCNKGGGDGIRLCGEHLQEGVFDQNPNLVEVPTQ